MTDTLLVEQDSPIKESYLETLQLIERLHRRFLDVVKIELDRLGVEDINNVQSLILWNIGDDDLTVGELTSRGYYLGSNVSYNVKKLVEHEYLSHERSAHDRRSMRVRLTDKGRALTGKMNEFHNENSEALAKGPLGKEALESCGATLRQLERFLSDYISYGRF